MIFLASDMSYKVLIFSLLGGLGLFLYGINLMGQSLKILAGERMKSIIEKLTNNPLKGILVGALVTALIQSSSGTSALTISLVRAGLMTLPQAIGVIMGANIGTTATALLLSFDGIKTYALPIMAFGSFLIFFTRNKKINQFGSIWLGFGMLFFGLNLIGDGLKPLTDMDWFTQLMLDLSKNSILGVIVGTGLTALVQSSSATIGVLQELYAHKAITLEAALPVLFGGNIGTTITAIIAALGGSIASRRASAAHVLFNVFGTVLFMIIFIPYLNLIYWIRDNFLFDNPKGTLAVAHLIFNVTNTFILFWFIKHIEKVVKIIIPGKDDISDEFNEELLNTDLIKESPIMALESSKKAIIYMGQITKKMFEQTVKYSIKQSSKVHEEVFTLETIINTLDRKIHDYLVKLTAAELNHDYSILHSKYMDIIRDYERIGDHCKNIVELYEYKYENKETLTVDAVKDINKMFEALNKMITNSLDVVEFQDTAKATYILEVEDKIDEMEKKARKRNTKRVHDGVCKSGIQANFVDIVSNLERIGDHCANIAEYIIYDNYYNMDEEDEDFITV